MAKKKVVPEGQEEVQSTTQSGIDQIETVADLSPELGALKTAVEEFLEPIKIIIPDNVKTIELTLEQLKETKSFADAHGFMPKQFPLEHHLFIQKLVDMANEVGAEPTVGNILASINGIERISPAEAASKGLNQEDAENTRVKVLIGRIDLGNKFARKLWNLAIGFMFNEKGIELCIGTNISICSNLTIYGEAKHYKNYGRGSVDLPEMFQHVEEWLANLDGIDIANSALLERMDAVDIDWIDTGNTFLGNCLRESVRKNYHKGNPFPLTMGQVNRIASYMINHEEDHADGERASLYHLYNAGTYILTHSDDLPNMFSNIKEFTHWFEETWLIPFENDDLLEELNQEEE